MYYIIYLHLVDFAWNMLVKHTRWSHRSSGLWHGVATKTAHVGRWTLVGTGVHLAIPENTRNFRLFETKLWKYIYIYIYSKYINTFTPKVREGFIKTFWFISSFYPASSKIHPPTILSSPVKMTMGIFPWYFQDNKK